MKIVLTESQLNELIQEEVNEANLLRSLLGLNSPDKIVSRIVLALLLGAITFTALPRVLNQVMSKNPSVEEQDKGKMLDRIKTLFMNVKNRESQITDRMSSDASGGATSVSDEAISQICRWETGRNFGYRMGQNDLNGYSDGRDGKKTYGYGLKTHPNGKFMEDIKPVWSQRELEQLFKEKIEAEKNWVLQWARKHGVNLSQGQLDAMVSAAYNYGHGGFMKTGIPAMIAKNPKDAAIPKMWKGLSDSQARRYPLLKARRNTEATWYETGIKH